MAVDMELRKAFAELQHKMVETQAQVNICDAQIKRLTIEEKKVDLTSKEISSLPEDVKLYESIGRMFMLEPRKVVLENLNNEKSSKLSKSKELEFGYSFAESSRPRDRKAKKTYLIRNVKSSETNLREMVSQRRK